MYCLLPAILTYNLPTRAVRRPIGLSQVSCSTIDDSPGQLQDHGQGDHGQADDRGDDHAWGGRAWIRGAWSDRAWVGLHGALAVWVAGLFVQQAALGRWPRTAAALESIGAGWLLATLAGLALVTGMTFLVGAGMDPLVRELAQEVTAGRAPALRAPWVQAGSALLVLVATLWGARVWPGLRRPWVLGVGLAAAGLAWFLPNLGGVWLALILAATTWRWRLAAAAVLAAAWIIGGFYYQLQWPLATKALVLVGSGASLGALAWLGSVSRPRQDPGRPERGGGGIAARWAIGLTLLTTLAAVNFGIWDKETLIARGRPVFVERSPRGRAAQKEALAAVSAGRPRRRA